MTVFHRRIKGGVMLFSVLLTIVVELSAGVWAHEGESHVVPEISAIPAPGSGLIGIGQTTETFELMLKYAPGNPGDEVVIIAFLSDAGTNAPIESARITGDVSDAGLTIQFVRTETPGVYRDTIRLPDAGTYSVIVDLASEGRVDLMVINGFRVGDSAPSAGWPGWPVGAGFGVAAVVLAGIVYRRVIR